MDPVNRVESRIAQIQERMRMLSRSPVSTAGSGWGSGLSNIGAGPPGTSFNAKFDATLASAMSTYGSSGAGLSRADARWGVDSLDAATATVVPVVLQIYGNGRIPSSALAPIGIGEHRLWAPAASAFDQMRVDAAADGVDIGVTDSYRGYDEQVDLVRRKGLYSQGGLGAVPGTSAHGWGLALDVDVNEAGQAWMRVNAGRYGFVETTPREPWHWEYKR